MKGLESKASAEQIVREVGMSHRPEFYSGRGATSSDLNDNKLELIYQGIKREYGKTPAKQFVQMVADIPKLTATDFLTSLYQLARRNWKWEKTMLGNEHGMDVGPDMHDGARETIAEITIVNTLFGMPNRNETRTIRDAFLRRHGVQVSELEADDGYYFY